MPKEKIPKWAKPMTKAERKRHESQERKYRKSKKAYLKKLSGK